MAYPNRHHGCYAAFIVLCLAHLIHVDCFLPSSNLSIFRKLSQSSTSVPQQLSTRRSTIHPRASSLFVHASYSCNGILISTGDSIDNALVVAFPMLALISAAAVFAYANVAYTSEILEEASSIRQENRELEVRKLIEAIHKHVTEGNKFEDLRAPLETALGVEALEEYMDQVLSRYETTDAPYGEADIELAQSIRDNL